MSPAQKCIFVFGPYNKVAEAAATIHVYVLF